MASLSKDGPNRWRIQFSAPDGTRKTLRLGRVSRKDAQAVCRHVEALLAARLSGQPLDRPTAAWLGEVGPDLRRRLAAVGLVEEQKAPQKLTVAGLVAEYLAARTDVKAGTRTNLDIAGRNLTAFLGEKLVEDVTEADAEAYFRHLTAEDGGNLAQNTARRRAGRARQFFAYAIRKRLITTNPFSTPSIKVAVGGNPERQFYVPVESIRSVIAEAPDAEWRLLIALSRFAGLRCPSEHLALTWADVLWDRGRLVVPSPKTEHLEGRGSRVVPLFPELEPYLREAFDLAKPGARWVISRWRNPAKNLRTAFLKMIRRAGLEPWPRLFHNLRASCQTDLANRFPAHVVCAWMGNSATIAREHYLQVTEEHFRAACATAAHPAAESECERLPLCTGQVTGVQGRTAGGENASTTMGGRGIRRAGTGRDEPVQKDTGSLQETEEACRVTPRGLEATHNSPQETQIPPEGDAESRSLAQILSLLEQLSSDGLLTVEVEVIRERARRRRVR